MNTLLALRPLIPLASAGNEEATEMTAKYLQNKKNVFLIILENNRTLLQ